VRLEIGRKIFVSFDMDRIRIFDKATEQAIMQRGQ
jgi:hypothetical protein